MNFATSVLAFASILLLAVDKPKSVDERVTLENLITAKPLPEGYLSSASEMKEGDKLQGNMIIVQKEGSTSKVVITIEPRELHNRAEKLATAKGYINGMSQTLTGAGMKLVKQKIPNLEKANLEKRVIADFVFQTADGNELNVQVQVFFTKVGHNVMVVANNKDDLKMLSTWAKSIQGVKSEDK